MTPREPNAEIPAAALSSPALLFLYRRIEQILGVKATGAALAKLDALIEKQCGSPFVENPAAYDGFLSSRERVFEISKTVTVNETYFFRESAHFRLLAGRFLPGLAGLSRPLRVCSAATSIGCEAYSLAMLLDFYGEGGRSFDFELDAFDACADAIETAKKGRYTANAFRADGSDWKSVMDRSLSRDGDEYVVSRGIRDKVRFFTHNAMRGLDEKYDLVFFRNALIYFSSKNRRAVMDNLAASLFDGGLLFLGVSETAAARHPSLASRNFSDVFCFQKIGEAAHPKSAMSLAEAGPRIAFPAPPRAGRLDDEGANEKARSPLPPRTPADRAGARKPDPRALHGEVSAILENAEGRPNAEKTLGLVSGGEPRAIPSGSELAAAAAYFLGTQDRDSADLVLSFLEKSDDGALSRFLRGEYHLSGGDDAEAVSSFERAAEKEETFWPALYRIASLHGEGNPATRERKIRRALDSLETGGGLRHECLMGGFSPDYFKRVLERKLPRIT